MARGRAARELRYRQEDVAVDSTDRLHARAGKALPPLVTHAATRPYQDRLQALIEADRIYAMLSQAAHDMERTVPGEKLAIAERIWFGGDRPFMSARKAWKRLEEELERWELQLEAERSALAHSILGIEAGDIVTTGNAERLPASQLPKSRSTRRRRRSHLRDLWYSLSPRRNPRKIAGDLFLTFRKRENERNEVRCAGALIS